MKKRNIAIIGAGLLMLSYVAKSQDFFNAMPGPKITQSDIHATIDSKTEKISGTYIEKIFPTINKNSKAVIALPIAVDDEGFDLKGINLGYMRQKILCKEIYATIATGAFEGSTGKLTQITPQLYATYLKDNLSVDLECKINFDTENKSLQKNAAITSGYGNNRIRGGASIILNDDKTPSYQILGRFYITKNHKYCVELYATSTKTIEIRFATNFF
jgi:hypothetical protein